MIAKSGVWAPIAVSGGALVCAMAVAGWHFASTPHPLPEALRLNSAPPASSAQPVPGPSQPAPAAASGPRIDIARILPNGDVVVAGRADPGARVALLDGGETMIETRADPQTGEFVFMPPRLGAGAHNLSLRSAPSVEGAQPMETAVHAFSIAPQVRAVTSVTSATSATSARTAPGPAIDPVKPATAGGTAIIARGDTLWRISRDKLGRGALYPTIVQANSSKIRNPNLIYPAQTLVIP